MCPRDTIVFHDERRVDASEWRRPWCNCSGEVAGQRDVAGVVDSQAGDEFEGWIAERMGPRVATIGAGELGDEDVRAPCASAAGSVEQSRARVQAGDEDVV